MKYNFKIKGLDCANCAAELERAIQKIDGVNEATISFMTEKLVIECDEEKKEEVSTTVQYIVVKIGNEQYGINIKYIDNIVRKQDITRVPKTQHYYKGVINLRGEIIPVMSVRLKLGLEDDVYTDKTRYIIVKVEGATIGIIVDEVREVVTLNSDDTESVNRSAGDEVTNNYISAIGKHGGELISLLDIVSLIVENK